MLISSWMAACHVVTRSRNILSVLLLGRYKVYKILASVGIDKPRFTVVNRDTPGEGFFFVFSVIC